jgi:uncharacterized protein YqfB (UPF0267 family)
MSVKPILFNTAMVKAILDGRKTVTRRLVKLPSNITRQEDGTYTLRENRAIYENQSMEQIQPYIEEPYKPGDILYVRETWQKAYELDDFDQIIEETGRYLYAAGPEDVLPHFTHWLDPNTGEYKEQMPWKPSIHMPKEAARIWLKVTAVRVERLNEMTASESVKEGISLPKEFDTKERAYILAFADLWDSTIKKTELDEYGWYANPWVWAIEFERCEKPESEEQYETN